MRQLAPEVHDDVDVEQLYAWVARPEPDGRPWVLLDMVTSIDGASSADGRSAGLSSPVDKQVFHALRTGSDAILVGAGTARAERFGPPRPDEGQRARRVERGLAERPRLVVVSRRLDLDPQLRLFADAVEPPIVVTCEGSDAGRRADLAGVAEVLIAGDAAVDLTGALGQLASRGIGVVDCEGGSTLNGALAAERLVDEVCLTISPLLLGGASARIVTGAPEDPDSSFDVAHLCEHDGSLFVRYVRRRS